MADRKKIWIMTGSFLGFLIVLYFVLTRESLILDTCITKAVYEMRTDFFTIVLKLITYLGNWQSIVILCLILLIIGKTRKQFGIPVTVSALTVTLLNKVIKIMVQRPRPDVSYHLIEQGGYSFPSGHSITSLAVFGMLVYLIQRHVTDRKRANLLTLLCSVPMVLIGISRIYLGVHYPSDVLGGWFLGMAVLMGIIIILEK